MQKNNNHSAKNTILHFIYSFLQLYQNIFLDNLATARILHQTFFKYNSVNLIFTTVLRHTVATTWYNL